MDTLHTVLRSLRPNNVTENKSRRDHLDVFREFLDHLDRAARKRAAARGVRTPRGKARRAKR